MKKAYGYCRASTGKQDLTFEVQQRSIERYSREKLEPQGFEWGGFFEDKATSGGKPFTERENGKRLWVVAQPGDAIIWHKMDRAFRSVRDGANTLHLLKEKRIAVHSIDIGLDTSSALGEFVCHLLMLLGELERSWVSTRTKEALAAKRLTGQPVNNAVPAGWKALGQKKSRYLEEDHTERDLLDDIHAEFVAGESMEKISNRLFFNKVIRANGAQYITNWLVYAMHARALGYPRSYDLSSHKEFIRSLSDAGALKKRRTGIIERIRKIEAARAARQTPDAGGPGGTSDASLLSVGHTQPVAQTP